MKVALLCECSGIVRNEFLKLGHDAISCDIKPTQSPGPHIIGDIFNQDWNDFDLIIAFPPCTFLTTCGNRWNGKKYETRYPHRKENIKAGAAFFMKIINMNNPMIAVENPVGIMNTLYRKPDQIIHPYYFGDTAQNGHAFG